MAFPIVFCAVMTMNRVSMCSSRARLNTSSPERSGILMSTRATSKLCARRAARASVPLATVVTACPCWAQARSRTQRMDSSSSATRIVAVPVPGLSAGVGCIVLAHGESDAERGAHGDAWLVGDRAAMLTHDAMADGETEAAAARLGGEEGREELCLVGIGHAGAGVFDQDGEEPAARSGPADQEAGLYAGGDGELAGAVEGFERVFHEVQEHLGQLGAIAVDRGEARVEGGAQLDRAPAGRLALERDHVVQDAVDVDRLELEARRDGQLAQLLHEPVEALHLADDDVGAVANLGIGNGAPDELRRPLDAAERIADLVGEPARHRAEGGETLGALAGGIERTLQGEVVQHEDGAAGHTIEADDGRAGGAHRSGATVALEGVLAATARDGAAAEGGAGHLRHPRGARADGGDIAADGLRGRH